VRTGLRVRPLDASALVDAPPRLRQLVAQPPVSSAWVTEVEYTAFALLVADVHDLDVAGFGRFWYDVMAGLITSPLYRVMLRWVSASNLLRMTAARWGAFHRGLQLEAQRTDDGLQLDLAFPEGMLPEVCVRGYTDVWQALIDHSSSTDAVARLVAFDRGSARYVFDGFR
jgi:hypothetical protein